MPPWPCRGVITSSIPPHRQCGESGRPASQPRPHVHTYLRVRRLAPASGRAPPQYRFFLLLSRGLRKSRGGVPVPSPPPRPSLRRLETGLTTGSSRTRAVSDATAASSVRRDVPRRFRSPHPNTRPSHDRARVGIGGEVERRHPIADGMPPRGLVLVPDLFVVTRFQASGTPRPRSNLPRPSGSTAVQGDTRRMPAVEPASRVPVPIHERHVQPDFAPGVRGLGGDVVDLKRHPDRKTRHPLGSPLGSAIGVTLLA